MAPATKKVVGGVPSLGVQEGGCMVLNARPYPRALQKKSQENINSRLALVMKSGKYTLGYKTCLKTMRLGKGERRPAPLVAPASLPCSTTHADNTR